MKPDNYPACKKNNHYFENNRYFNKYYAGIGSRKTPEDILSLMRKISCKLEKNEYILRSGGALGADLAFEQGTSHADIYVPYFSFNEKHRKVCENVVYKVINSADEEAFKSVKKFHPSPDSLKDVGKLMMARNYRQIVGLNEPNSQFVICWTEGGEERGGTGQAIRIANHFNIPVYNLGKEEIRERLEKFVE